MASKWPNQNASELLTLVKQPITLPFPNVELLCLKGSRFCKGKDKGALASNNIIGLNDLRPCGIPIETRIYDHPTRYISTIELEDKRIIINEYYNMTWMKDINKRERNIRKAKARGVDVTWVIIGMPRKTNTIMTVIEINYE